MQFKLVCVFIHLIFPQVEITSQCFVIVSILRTPASVASKLVMSRVPTPPPNGEMSSGPVAESWCYTQVSAELQV